MAIGHNAAPARPRVAIVGAGWAGLAAAVELAPRADVTLFEAGRAPGGRARALGDGSGLDNGQHILIGAYVECLRLMRTVGLEPDSVLRREPMNWIRLGGLQLRCPPLPAPWHVALGLVMAKGLSIGSKLRLAWALQKLRWQGWKLAEDLPVLGWLQQQRQSPVLIEEFWRPLVLSALNTPPERASMQVLATVLRDSLGAKRAASDLLLPKVDLSTLFPNAALAWLQAQGVAWRPGVRVRALQATKQCTVVQGEAFDAVIVAVAPYHLPHVLPESPLVSRLQSLHYWPIYTVYLQFGQPVSLPQVMTGLRGGTADWLFDRAALTGESGLVAAVLSAPSGLEGIDQQELVRRVLADVRRLVPEVAEPLSWRVVVEKRATFAAEVGRWCPPLRAAGPGCYLAGDWLMPDYPATLEGAVRSGVAAARALLADYQS